MANPVPDGVYSISLSSGGAGSITDTGEGRYLSLLPHGALGDDADKINVAYKPEKGAYSLQFAKSGKYLTWLDEPRMNNKLVTGDKPRYFKIAKHEYYEDLFIISVAEDKQYHLAMALERIFPPWVALNNYPDKQPWGFKKA
ncbi:hypothetical protein FRC07_003651 [Ceratobasidium sp. 392]|nr:hypothetical protein FRC07_003651 [Ceratobasidium sp. 392]